MRHKLNIKADKLPLHNVLSLLRKVGLFCMSRDYVNFVHHCNCTIRYNV